jgi:HlyD family secretion protein
MTRKKKWLLGVGGVVVAGGLAYANMGLNRPTGTAVTVEKIDARDLESIVSASGKIQPKRSVNISAETMGKVMNLHVREGDLVTKGQLLLQIDSKNLETNVQNREASLASAKLQLDQTRAQIDNSRVALKEAEDTMKRQEQMFKNGLLPRDQWERIVNDVARQKTNLQVSESSARTQEQRIKQEEANLSSANYDLTKLRVLAPITGIVTRRNIEEGETAVVGTMNNAGTVLLTIADLSVIETEIEVDETTSRSSRSASPRRSRSTQLPDQEIPGKVDEVGNSPIQALLASSAPPTSSGRDRSTARCRTSARDSPARPVVTTATRQKVLSVPIQAMTLREVVGR